ncbi:MAG: DUF3365 domain-containing protein [Candidatus Marinimicrobia bacterium]|nr:DUF3365 domain-containing protein [Candidatus Neomarinimicrobiota bacterium]
MRIVLLTGLFFGFLTLSSCNDYAAIQHPAPAEAEQLQRIGSEASSMLLTNLQPALINAFADGGATNAISVCADTAQELTENISEKMGPGVRVTRTTYKTRNPANAPDTYEKAALDFYHRMTETGGSLPAEYMQKIIKGDSTFFRYYKPLKMGGLCLNCHGQEAQIAPEVMQTIQKHYPNDEAVGYEDGEFRGLVSVTVKREL